MNQQTNEYIEERVREFEEEYSAMDNEQIWSGSRIKEYLYRALTETWNESRLDAIQEINEKLPPDPQKLLHSQPFLAGWYTYKEKVAATLSTMRQEKGV